jgi:predicted secreted protein
MNMKTGMKQVVTFALVALVIVVIIPLIKQSFKPTPGLQARVGETFTVTLDSDANAAYRWDLLATDETKVQLVHRPDAREAMARTEVWTFRALAPGKVTLYFGYLRIDSPNQLAARSKSVLLTINP